MVSYAAETDPFKSYFKIIGLHLFSDKNAPFLNLISEDPFVVPPSGNTSNGLYYPVSSTYFYLSDIIYIAFFLVSSSLPLGK